MDPIQTIIFERTLNLRGGGMIAKPEVVQFGRNLINLIQAKKAIDIGENLKQYKLTKSFKSIGLFF